MILEDPPRPPFSHVKISESINCGRRCYGYPLECFS